MEQIHTHTQTQADKQAVKHMRAYVCMYVLSFNLRFYAFPFAYFESLVHTYHTNIPTRIYTHTLATHTHIDIVIYALVVFMFFIHLTLFRSLNTTNIF